MASPFPSSARRRNSRTALPHGLGFNYSLADATGEAAVVEAAPAALAVRQGEGLACTNHFQTPALQPYNRRATGRSRRRLPPLEAWAARGLSAEALFRAFNDSTSPAFHHAYGKGFGTLHTLVCEPASRTMLIGIGGDAPLTRVDVAGWARGDPLPVTPPGGVAPGTSARLVRIAVGVSRSTPASPGCCRAWGIGGRRGPHVGQSPSRPPIL